MSREFADRHLGPSPTEIETMLATLGVGSVAELVDRAVPESIRDRTPLDLPAGLTEAETLARLRELADRNEVLVSLIGQGYSGTFTPPVIQRNVLENPAWYTAYTPYQPEISQGRLAGAPQLPDHGERPHRHGPRQRVAARRSDRGGRGDDHAAAGQPEGGRHVLRRRRVPPADDRRRAHPGRAARHRRRRGGAHRRAGAGDLPAEGVFGVLLQYPGTTGGIRDDRELVADLHAQGTLVAVATDLLALVLLAPPGEWGADVVVGSAQRFGVPMGYGGPHAGFFATREEYKRNLPGRLVGVSVDAAGRPALRLALQTREQHIRREKATSNICTAQVLLANIAGMYAVYHGPDGLRAIAERVHGFARRARGVGAGGGARHVLRHRRPCASRMPTTRSRAARAAGLNLRRVAADTVGIALDETTTPRDRRSGRARCSRSARLGARRAGSRFRRRCGARPTSSCTRCSAPTTPRRRCCATCARWPTATSRSTAR